MIHMNYKKMTVSYRDDLRFSLFISRVIYHIYHAAVQNIFERK
ncbi:hypothetical protein IGI84_000206 [Enterococcus sp. DIV0008]